MAGASVYKDSSASGGKAARLTKSGSLSATTQTGINKTLGITASGNQCDGAPTMQVRVDGKTVATQSVKATKWTHYTYAASLAAGSHKLQITYTNLHEKKFTFLWIFSWTLCRRSLQVDSVSYSGTTATTSTPSTIKSGSSGSSSPSTSPTSSAKTSPAHSSAPSKSKSASPSKPAASGSPTASPKASSSSSASPSVSPSSTPVEPTGVTGSWTLKFDDEFSGTSLDTTKWAKSWYSGTNNVTSSASNIAVAGGVLKLTLSDANTGAIVTTKPGGSTTGFTLAAPSIWEARILFPSDGTNIYNWPAFWVLNDSPGNTAEEIDIAEPWDGVMQTNYHVGSSNPSHSYAGYRDGKFHVWTMYRTTTTMYFYVDGTLVYTLPKAAADNGHAQYAILNVGRTSSGNHTVYGAASTVQVDYVRAWQ